MNTQLLSANEALKQMDQMINKPAPYRAFIGDTIKDFPNVYEWFKAIAADDLKVNTQLGYIDIFHTKHSLMILLKDKATNKVIKKLYFNADITKDFTLAYDGLYYNTAWSKSGKDIEIDGLGHALENVREYFLEYEVIDDILERKESLIDDIRKYFL